MSWKNPTKKQITEALEGWEADGWRMTNVRVERISEKSPHPLPEVDDKPHPAFTEHGEHFYAETDFEVGGKPAGRFRVRYRADGVAYLEHVYLAPEFARSGGMTQLLDDFQAHYREWGLDRILDPTPAPAGVAFAEANGFTQVNEGDDSLYERKVAPE